MGSPKCGLWHCFKPSVPSLSLRLIPWPRSLTWTRSPRPTVVLPRVMELAQLPWPVWHPRKQLETWLKELMAYVVGRCCGPTLKSRNRNQPRWPDMSICSRDYGCVCICSTLPISMFKTYSEEYWIIKWGGPWKKTLGNGLMEAFTSVNPPKGLNKIDACKQS